MITITLPETLPGTLDLAALNRQLQAGTTQLDWTAVVHVAPDALQTLLTGLDLADDADCLGLASMPGALVDSVLAALQAQQKSRAEGSSTRRQTRQPKPVATPLWPPTVSQLPLPEAGQVDEERDGHSAQLAVALTEGGARPIVEMTTAVLQRVSQTTLRRTLQAMVAADLLGPAGGEEEEIANEGVTERYLVGMLAPHRVPVRLETQDALAVSAGDASEDDSTDLDAVPSATLFPSSIGFTCSVSGKAKTLRVSARWGRYERVKSATLTNPKTGNAKMVWKRRQMSGTIDAIPIRAGAIAPQRLCDDQPAVYLRGQIRRLEDNWLCTLFLVNGQQDLRRQADSAWLFQVELSAESPDGAAIFCRHPITQTYHHMDSEDQRERRAMAMLYRHQTEFAVGHGVAVHVTQAPNATDAALRIETRAIPAYETPQTVSPAPEDIPGLGHVVLDMKALAELDAPALVAALLPLRNAYTHWIAEQATRVTAGDDELDQHAEATLDALANCRSTLDRIREGISMLESNDKAFQAFRFMNQAMWLQRIHTLAAEATRRGEQRTADSFDTPEHRTWRLFQLAFILINLPALTDLRHPDRSLSSEATADLLWFPTGGGKTEAYLGLTAYTLAMRRLQGTIAGYSGDAGVGVLMRYTLRLLTLQQFQRASALICACEQIRQHAASQGDMRWGSVPFRLGLWVGQRTTPNWTDQSAEAILQEHGRYRQASALGVAALPRS